MKRKWFIAIVLVAAAAIALIVLSVVTNVRTEHRATLMKLERSEVDAPSPRQVPKPPPIVRILAEEIQPVPEAPQPAKLAQTNLVEVGVVQVPKPKKSKPPIQDPAARVALSFVGADPDAEEYWYAAINDPTLSEHERKDLIEDLNEDGLSDPKHPGPQDMPLILSRIRLIELLAPFSMDQVNAEAFAEAYKDLINLADGGPAN